MRALRHLDALQPAREIRADVEDVGRPLFEREQRVEARDAVCVGGRHVQPARGVAERALAHIADAPLRRAQSRKEQVAAAALGTRDAVPVRGLGADDRVDRLALVRGRLRDGKLQVHQVCPRCLARPQAVPGTASGLQAVRKAVPGTPLRGEPGTRPPPA
jgi:hypothetical protein